MRTSHQPSRSCLQHMSVDRMTTSSVHSSLSFSAFQGVPLRDNFDLQAKLILYTAVVLDNDTAQIEIV